MSLFDKLKNKATGAVNQTARSTVNQATKTAGQAAGNIIKGSNKSVQVVFNSMPETVSEFTALPQAQLSTPFDTAALFVAALCVYPLNKDECVAMINHLKGPAPLGTPDIQFLTTRMQQNNKAGFLGASYFDGATAANDYAPSEPFTVTVSENPYSYDNAGYAKVFVKSGGADTPRAITSRQAKDGKWYLWEYSSILVDILSPESTNVWSTREFI